MPFRPRAGVLAVAATCLALAACSLGDGSMAPAGSGGHGSGATTQQTPTGSPTTAADGTVRGKPFSITIAAAGDVLTHVPVRNDAAADAKKAGQGAAYDFTPMFAKVKPIISAADLALCHMETPVSQTDSGLSRPGVLVFNTPHEILEGVRSAGYEGCDFASNHEFDQGLSGLRSTQAAFKAAGLGYAGPSADPKSPRAVATYTVKGVKVTHLAYSYTVLNNWGPNTQLPKDAPWLKETLWPARGAAGIIADAKAAKQAGADVVVVSFHWGQEYISAPTKDQTTMAKALLASPYVDLILGTHVHVVQPCQTINDKFVFYGMGNSLSNQAPSQAKGLRPETQEGMIATVTLDRDAAGKVTEKAVYTPTRVNLTGHVIEPVTKASNPTTYARVHKWITSLPASTGTCTATESTS